MEEGPEVLLIGAAIDHPDAGLFVEGVVADHGIDGEAEAPIIPRDGNSLFSTCPNSLLDVPVADGRLVTVAEGLLT